MRIIATEGKLGYLQSRARDVMIRLVSRHTEASFRKHQMRLAVIPTDFIGRSIISQGIFTGLEIELLSKLLKHHSDSVMLDIGANIGNHAIALGKYFQKVICFEPYGPNAALLRANILLSQRTNITVEEVGLGREHSILPFYIDQSDNLGSGRFCASKTAPALRMHVCEGDSILRTRYPEIFSGKVKIGFVKCDVEGLESDVFLGLTSTLSLHKPIVCFESNDAAKGNQSWTVLQQYGYSHLYELKANDYPCSRFTRELIRMLYGRRMWIKQVSSVPSYACDLIAAPSPVNDE